MRAAFFFFSHYAPSKFLNKKHLTLFRSEATERRSVNLVRINRKRWENVTEVAAGEISVT